MDLRSIIIDVIKDFERINSLKVDSDKIIEVVLSQKEWSLESYGIENEYALVMELMYFLQSEIDDLRDIDKNRLNKLVGLYIGDGINTHIEKIEVFKWVPEVLEKTWEDGQKLFDIAKNVYFGKGDNLSKEVANTLFESIQMASVSLEGANYKYRDKKEILEMYEHELSESQLDIDMINEGGMFMSLRLSEYIQSLDAFNDNAPDFSCESPFSMKDNIFSKLITEEKNDAF
jgi:hypothetical protein